MVVVVVVMVVVVVAASAALPSQCEHAQAVHGRGWKRDSHLYLCVMYSCICV